MFNKTDPSIFEGEWNFEKTERAIMGLTKILNRYAHKLTLEDLRNDPRCARIPDLSLDVVQQVIDDVEAKLWRGVTPLDHEVIYHTGPHHDDIMLGIMPFINRQLRNPNNEVHFAIMTSGYHSVTDDFLRIALQDTLFLLRQGKIQMVHYPDFFEQGYRFKQEKDIYHFLDNVARKNPDEMRRGFCHRILRDAVGLWHLRSIEELESCLNEQIKQLSEGRPNSPEIQNLKGEVREFEEELVWAYTGTSLNNIHHLRLGFYSHSDDFPNRERDVDPVLNQLRELKPTVISVAMDYEGLGPNTHFKVMLAIAEAIKLWKEEADLGQLKIYGYRNVWSTFHPAEANVYVPVSLNALAVFEKAFKDSYLTQVKAEFPNPDFDGPFSELAESIWVKQLKDVQLILGKNYFYENSHPLIRATHGLLFLRQMNVDEFIRVTDEMKHNI